MATIRRLSDGDVRAIFESLHGDHPPPPHLKFQIVSVGPNGLKLSPPSYEFEDGLYVLLQPDKKRKRSDEDMERSRIPPHLSYLAAADLPPETCPWSLSGPQFPQPTAIQQRYCYPKGNKNYSSRKGGALWTMYGRDGKEDLEFRLLHVYFSAKRAVNKGMPLSAAERAKQQEQQKVASTPKRKRISVPRSVRSPWQEPYHRRGMGRGSLTSVGGPHNSNPSNTRNGGRMSMSPVPPLVDRISGVLPPPSPCQTHRAGASIFVTPNTTAYPSNTGGEGYNGFECPPFHPVSSFDVLDGERLGSHSPIRGRASHRRAIKQEQEEEIFRCRDIDTTTLGADWGHEVDLFTDPLFDLVLKPSVDSVESNGSVKRVKTESPSCKNLAKRLQVLHDRIRSGILEHPVTEQGPMLAIVASWARDVAKSPLKAVKPEAVGSSVVADQSEQAKDCGLGGTTPV